jgi:hypothetical protein
MVKYSPSNIECIQIYLLYTTVVSVAWEVTINAFPPWLVVELLCRAGAVDGVEYAE